MGQDVVPKGRPVKILIGRNANEVEFFNDDDTPMKDFYPSALDIKLRPGLATEVTMTVYVKEINVAVEDDQIEYLTTERHPSVEKT